METKLKEHVYSLRLGAEIVATRATGRFLTFRRDLEAIEYLFERSATGRATQADDSKTEDFHVESGILQSPIKSFRCPRREIAASWLYQLQRVAAHVMLCNLSSKENLLKIIAQHPDPDSDDTFEQALDSAYDIASHLLCRSVEGYTVPTCWVGPPKFGTEDDEIPGGWICSSVRMQQELLQLCPALGIPLRPLQGTGFQKALRLGGGFDIREDVLEFLQLNSENVVDAHQGTKVDSTLEPLAIELHVWFLLYEATKWSVTNNTAVVIR